MFLMHKPTGDLIEILTLDQLFNPCAKEVTGVDHFGEEMQDPACYQKIELAFPSGERLPRCWLDAHYRDTERSTNQKELSLKNG
ncbi:acetyltransferase [Chlorogloeopsis sp. ULAP01]|uniref:acetyltransferase n=1 Tax=Chlorogloeopsis sp. ULAP01 TaxID=3056483 RepID=UPI0025AAB7E4|nr:acetyltransferase [Chlorogloeopsis sp. ULAP01]MDM9385508.1 acetyltransferase [Chlorogloeopsis sp. ULAP01]